jgi:hypothetical protein
MNGIEDTNRSSKSLSMAPTTQLIAQLKRLGEVFIPSPLLPDPILRKDLTQLHNSPSKITRGDGTT